jgi:LPXTG-motif cell wall-anchored protein
MAGLNKLRAGAMRKGLGILGLALFAGLVQAPGAAAETGDQWPLTAATAPVQIDPAGLYGSSGNQIFKFTGLQNGQAGTELTAQTAPGAPAYWSSNLGLGRDAQGSLEFVGSRYNTGQPALYSLKNGASSITEIGSAPQTSAAWGGLSVAPDGGIWQGTNLQSTGNSRLSRFDQQAGTGVISGPLTSTLAGDRIWDGGGVVAPDYAFDAAGNLFGLVFNRGEGWIYRYNIDSFSASGMTVTPWLQISGPALTAGSSNYGFAWLGGNWYAGNGNGTLYRINAETGASVVAGEVTTPSTFDYRLTDLASAELVPGPRLEVTKSADRTVVDPGGVVRFTLTGTNTGAATFAADFADELSEVLDEADYNGDASADIGSIGLSGQRLLWRGELAPGQRVTVTFSVTVKAVVPGDYRLVNRVTSTVPEAVLPPPVTVDITRVLPPDPRFEVTKSADRTVVDPGGVVRFTLTGTNTGAATFAADFADELSEVLDEADYNGDASADIGSIGLSGQRLLWRGELAPGQRVTVTFSVTVKAVVPGDYRLVNRVSSTVPEAVLPPPVTVDISGFVLTKTVDRTVAAPGDQVSYTVVGRNVGRTPLRAGFSDDLSQVLDDAAFRGDVDANTGRVWSSADSIRWSGRLLPGQAVTVTYQVVVRAGGGDGILRNSVTSSTSGGQETTPVQTTVREVPGTPQADRAVQPVGPGAPGSTTETLPNTGSATAALIFSGALAALLGLVLLAAARFRPEEDRS